MKKGENRKNKKEKKQESIDNKETLKTKIEKEKDIKLITKKSKDMYLIYAIIAILFVLGVIFSVRYFTKEKEETPIPETKVYNGFTFVKVGNYWQTKIRTERSSGIDEYDILFHFTPDEVEFIPTEKNVRNQTITPYLFMNTKRVYITTNPEYPSSVVIGGVEISKIIGQVFRKEVKGALTRPVNNKSNTPVITCDDLNDEQRVIYLKLGNETKIYSDNGCIIVQGEDPIMLIKASERLAFEILKIL